MISTYKVPTKQTWPSKSRLKYPAYQNSYIITINEQGCCWASSSNSSIKHLLIDPMVQAALPVGGAFREPQSNFFPCTLNWITSVNNIPAKKNKNHFSSWYFQIKHFPFPHNISVSSIWNNSSRKISKERPLTPAGDENFQTKWTTGDGTNGTWERNKQFDNDNHYKGRLGYLPISTAKSPRIVPGADSEGFVAPIIFRPVVTTFFPSHTIATTGPEII